MADTITPPKGEILIYKAKDGTQQLDVRLEDNTVWLNQKQIADLFGIQRPAITKHLSNIFKSGELTEKSVSSILEHTAKDGKTYKTQFYNLDAIISVGYRVNSRKATRFRIWATGILRDHLVSGYTLNEKRLLQVQQNMKHLEQTIKLLQQTGQGKELSDIETKGLLEIITNYTQSFILLNQFDSNELTTSKLNENVTYEIEYDQAVTAIAELKKQLIKKKEASALFGTERNEAFSGILNSVVQTFDREYLYKSIEEQAAHHCILLSRITRLRTAINASAPFYLYGFLKRTNTVLKNQVSLRSMTMRW
ncbi:MAG TPA: RhuM family protein [Chitinophagaceae bacterium]